jgi:hypothetical protein
VGSFGNYVGATMGTSKNENGQSGAVYDNSFVTNSYYPKRQALLAPDGKSFVHVDDFTAGDKTKGVYPDLYTTKLGDVPGLLSDDSTNQQVVNQLTGPKKLNWESKSFNQLKAENEALNPSALNTQATAWTEHGDQLKTASETFKTKVRAAITGHWSGESAAAAETATHQVTETSIYNFTPASDALKQRLALLCGAFNAIKQNFPPGNDLIDAGNFNAEQLDAKIHDFNSRYHIDGSGHLRNNSDGYVTAADALRELEQIRNSIRDYQKAVQLFRDTYNPTVEAATDNFPQLPSPPNMTFGQQGPGPNPTGTGPYNTTGGGPPSTGNPAITPTDFGKNKAIPDLGKDLGKDLGTGDNKPIDPSQTDIPDTSTTSDPTQTAAKALDSGLNAATQGLQSGLGAATQAAQQAAQAASGAAKPALPDGALGLGPKPEDPKGVGGAGKGAAAGGGGAGGHQPAARLSSQPATSVAGARATMPAAATSAMGGMGSPGMGGGGAPGAGGKGASDGKEHKGNKALRTRKNGADIVGDTDAVVPVLGGEQAPAADDEQPAPPPRRIPQRGDTWRPDTAVQGGPRRSPQTQQSAGPDQLVEQ